jgi:hypothetical protein
LERIDAKCRKGRSLSYENLMRFRATYCVRARSTGPSVTPVGFLAKGMRGGGKTWLASPCSRLRNREVRCLRRGVESVPRSSRVGTVDKPRIRRVNLLHHLTFSPVPLEIRRSSMIPPLDLFAITANGEPLWVSAAETLPDAFKMARERGPGRYFVVSHETGNETMFEVDRDGEVRRVDS